MIGSAEQAVADDHGADDGVAASLVSIRARMVAAATAVGRDPATITLVGACKAQPLDRVQAALAAGQRVYGENYVQEAIARWSALRPAHPDVQLHMIGPIQTNKVPDVVGAFDVIETVDRPKLAKALARAMARQDRRPDCFVQVNTGEEPQKAGVWPADVDAFVASCRDQLELPVVGLMAVPPIDEEPGLHFALLAEIARRNGLAKLSMGMSADFEIAIQFGATHVRVGSALFGARPPR